MSDDISQLSIKELLNGGVDYVIPMYQRNYAAGCLTERCLRRSHRLKRQPGRIGEASGVCEDFAKMPNSVYNISGLWLPQAMPGTGGLAYDVAIQKARRSRRCDHHENPLY